MKKKILIIIGTYLPGYKGGGPVTSIRNLVETLGNKYEFQILTSDRDIGDAKAYVNIQANRWTIMNNTRVFYVDKGNFQFELLMNLCNAVDIIYLCGCFNSYSIKTLLLKRIGLIKRPVIVAAMGLFSDGAFGIRKSKKEIFLLITRKIGLYRNIKWSATTDKEILDIKKRISREANCFVAQDLPRIVQDRVVYKQKESGGISIVFLSRISPEKNLEYALDVVCKLIGKISFTIYGPIENQEYWSQCLIKLNNMPSNITWSYQGELNPAEVVSTLEHQDLLLLPTLGENYGHVIQEALATGCITVISDKTPWSGFEQQGIGGIIPLEQQNLYVETLQKYIEMDSLVFQKASMNAIKYAIKSSNNDEISKGYENMFDSNKLY